MLEPEPGAAKLAGVGIAVTPEGKPTTVSATAALNPPATVTVACTDPAPPCAILTELLLKPRVKLPAASR